MQTFEQYVNNVTLQPMIRKAAKLFVDLEIDPEEYFNEATVPSSRWATGTRQAQHAAHHAVGAGLTGAAAAGNLTLGATQNAWSNVLKPIGRGLKNSAVGQGVKSWWTEFRSPDRQLEIAARKIQKVLSDPVVVSSNGGSDKEMLVRIVNDLTTIADHVKIARRASASPAPSQPSNFDLEPLPERS